MQAWNIVEELRATEERITRYTNNPYDGLMCAAANEIERLILELQKRDKCSYMGPMRDCPTHGESKDAARYRWLKRQPWVKTKGIHAWGALLDDAIDEARHDAPDETPNAKSQATDAALSRQVACTDGLGVAVPPAPTFEQGD